MLYQQVLNVIPSSDILLTIHPICYLVCGSAYNLYALWFGLAYDLVDIAD